VATVIEDAEPHAVEPEQAGEVEVAETEIKETSGDASEVIVSLGAKKLTMAQIAWRAPNASDHQIAGLAKWWLDNEILYDEAEKRGVTNDPNAKFFAEMMRKSGFVEALIKQIRDAVSVSDERALAYYEENKETDPRLSQQGYLTFSHITTGTLSEAEAVLKRLKAGENINELARELSADSDAKRGGVARRMMYRRVKRRFGAEFFEAITAAEKDELIGPVEVEGEGYDVARKEEETKPKPIPFEEVKDRIKSQLGRAEKDKAFKELLDSLKQEAADKIVKSQRLIEAEKAAAEKPMRTLPTRPRPEPAPKPTSP